MISDHLFFTKANRTNPREIRTTFLERKSVSRLYYIKIQCSTKLQLLDICHLHEFLFDKILHGSKRVRREKGSTCDVPVREKYLKTAFLSLGLRFR